MDKLVNGCTKQETLELMELLQDVPFCHTWQMSKCDECGDEFVYVGFDHYQESYTAKFNSVTHAGELFLEFKLDDDWFHDYYGIITVANLVKLLNSLPHISKYLEDEDISNTLH